LLLRDARDLLDGAAIRRNVHAVDVLDEPVRFRLR
jgi:hypothetical protein